MKLSENDAKLFFDLMWPLHYFANRELNILPRVNTLQDYIECPTEEKAKIRGALFAEPKLIDKFIRENPENFTEEKLAVIAGWKKSIAGDFHIERYLKKYAIFIKEEKVYGVSGLRQGIDELFHRSHLPLYVKTVLLPFQGKIVCDGLFEIYNLYFGGGIKRTLKETYMRAKQNHRIIDTFDPAPKKAPKRKAPKARQNPAAELNDLAATAKKLRGSTEDPVILGQAFSLVRASIEFAQQAVTDPNDWVALHQALKKVRRAYSKSNTVLSREEF